MFYTGRGEVKITNAEIEGNANVFEIGYQIQWNIIKLFIKVFGCWRVVSISWVGLAFFFTNLPIPRMLDNSEV